MGWANKLIGWASGNGAEVDTGNNLRVTTPQANQRLGGEAPAPNLVGAHRMFSENDAGSITGVADLMAPFISHNRRLKVGNDTLLWHSMFPSNAQNTALWKHLFTTMTATQAGDGFILLNANLTATTTTGCSMQSWKYFSFLDICTLQPTIQLSITNGHPVANQVLEAGFFIPTATDAPTDGLYVRYTTNGLYAYLKFGGNAEVPSGQLMAPNSLTLNKTHDISFHVDERFIEIWMQGVRLGEIVIPDGQSNITQGLSLPLAFQQRNSGAVAGTQMQAKVSCTSVLLNEIAANMDWAMQMACLGQAYQGMDGGTMGSLASYSAAALAAAAALTTTGATGGATGLGGAVLVLPTLAAGSDGVLFAYQNPLGTLQQPARTLVVFGVNLDASVQTILAGGPLNYIMGIAFGSTAKDLATAESASFANNTTKAPRRIVLGQFDFLATAAAGSSAANLRTSGRRAPIFVNPGEWFVITARNQGTVTTTGAVLFTADVDHIFM